MRFREAARASYASTVIPGRSEAEGKGIPD